jgi:hypothetical protein
MEQSDNKKIGTISKMRFMNLEETESEVSQWLLSLHIWDLVLKVL